ncbi:chorismate synthase [Geochorda subterranea]|uniref:Chorismate synthase n=1 Tax=Geochorda subterranea TaxID=3109564 RepID=A0ABZ1BL22_9FIRM|nr:chorismate synthase [Limnochorda sp. LNt]WRP13474.1 chorismate synthase [Limnochorda sp. LNt]
MLRFLTAGESHGPGLCVIVEGLPAGLPLEAEAIDHQLRRRQVGHGSGRRMQIETDRVEILSGVRHGLTLGSPVAMRIANRDFERWRRVMDPAPPVGPLPTGGDWRLRPVTRPRPGHADLAGALKYDFDDVRNVLERASARETAARVAAGAVARRLLESLGISLVGHVVAIGPVRANPLSGGAGVDWHSLASQAEASPVRCGDPLAAEAMMRAIDEARARGDTLGGVLEVVALGVMPGLGSYVHWDRRLDGRLAMALMSIPGVKGVEIGDGFWAATQPGSSVHDPIAYGDVPADQWAADARRRGFWRPSNRSGGLEGGVTTGQPVVVRAAMKPLSTLMQPLGTVDLRTREPTEAAVERSDVCAVPRAVVVAEAMVAWVLAEAVVDKFGGDTLEDLAGAVEAYRRRLARTRGPT